MRTSYDHLVHQRCQVTATGEEVWVLGLMVNPDGTILAHIDGTNIPRGTVVKADKLELA